MPHLDPRDFKANAALALADAQLASALGRMSAGLVPKRAEAVAALPEFEALRARAREIKDHALDNLDHYLEVFARNCEAAGGQVHWCATADEARLAILEICRARDAKTVTKGKSMVAEELHLNAFLERHGIQPIETDLGEYIVQLADEVPSHIIAPAIHKTKEQISDLFAHHHKSPRRNEPEALIGEAREVLRQRFLDADVGITGANFLVAETGSSIIVTNEGNGDLTQALPRVHIVIASLEKVVPTLEDAATILRVLARSATGQEFSTYTTLSTGPKREGDIDGPEEYHVILLDNGRSEMLAGPFREALRCIRCGACMNHCPVYHAIGGHAYGWVYPGPIGAVLTPSLIGVEEAGHLPNASTFCGRCEAVCPMRIPLPKLMRKLREREFEKAASPWPQRAGIKIWAFFAKRPRLYRRSTNILIAILARFGRRRGTFRYLPFAGGWTKYRELPAPQGRTFHQLWREQRNERVHK